MSLKIYDTARREKVAFEPIDPSNVRMYVCGPTVYDYIHIGNARPLVVFDVLYRLLKTQYPNVKYVRNITDVDDKINARAKENGESIRDLTERTNQQFQDDAKAIGNLEPDVQPRATEHIQEMQDIIQRLIERGHAYAAEGHVLFDTKSWDQYGKFANKDLEELEEGARVEVAPYKKNAADFVLWKPSTDDIPGWDSPWGRGRPGWHIECSAMSAKHLGESFDIHGGGLDLIFPHHQNEVAQSCCGNERDRGFAKYWMHNGYLMSEGTKMSKSLGNFYTVHELLEESQGESLRLAILRTHYRKPLDFSKDGLKSSKEFLDKLYRWKRQILSRHRNVLIIEELEQASNTIRHPYEGFEEISRSEGEAKSKILKALLDDLNTSLAFTEFFHYAEKIQHHSSDQEAISFIRYARLLGILQQDPEAWFKGDAGEDDAAEIEALIQKRADAKANKDFATADAVRDELTSRGIVLEDKPGGKTEWRRA